MSLLALISVFMMLSVLLVFITWQSTREGEKTGGEDANKS